MHRFFTLTTYMRAHNRPAAAPEPNCSLNSTLSAGFLSSFFLARHYSKLERAGGTKGERERERVARRRHRLGFRIGQATYGSHTCTTHSLAPIAKPPTCASERAHRLASPRPSVREAREALAYLGTSLWANGRSAGDRASEETQCPLSKTRRHQTGVAWEGQRKSHC